MAGVLQRSLKRIADACVRAVCYYLPNLAADVEQVVLPAVPPYVLPMPLNAAQLPVAYRQQFGETLNWPERRVYLLHNAQVSWHGIVFRNLRLFRPSVSPLITLEAEFSGAFLLRQWWGKRQNATSEEVVGLAHGPWSVGNYYHWLIDTLPRLLFLGQHYPGCRLLVPENLPAYAHQTATIFGFNQLLQVPPDTTVSVPRLAVSDYAACSGYQDAATMQVVRETILQSFHIQTSGGSRRIFVSRSRQPLRRLLNEAALEPLLRQYNFETVYFEDLTFEAQVRLMHETAVLVGVHGANLTNMLFMAPQATIVELMYVNREQRVFNPCYYHLAFALGLAYYNVPCHGAGPPLAVDSNDIDLEVDPTELQQVFLTLFNAAQ